MRKLQMTPQSHRTLANTISAEIKVFPTVPLETLFDSVMIDAVCTAYAKDFDFFGYPLTLPRTT